MEWFPRERHVKKPLMKTRPLLVAEKRKMEVFLNNFIGVLNPQPIHFGNSHFRIPPIGLCIHTPKYSDKNSGFVGLREYMNDFSKEELSKKKGTTLNGDVL